MLADAAILEDRGWIVIWTVVQDSTGQVLAACYKKMKGLFDSYKTEVLAMRESLYFAINLGFLVIILVNDSLNVILIVQIKSNDLSAAGLIITDIISQLNINRSGSCNFICCSTLAKISFSLSSSMFWFGEISNYIDNLMANDFHF
ncbi:hypothetical protein PanWU01x14_367200 [Parasponia andersonii]|uniref:RNase H type-1 domain-containing protein n=1 Tax=Parasponia andersonii TaxID=3476 RepID=A0A2P5A5B8_PARAD|nr:hypothetical protein PanWU01x14_367200 [Parasponia andersonii]